VVGFSGGRALSGPPAALVARVASAVLGAGSPVFVGCALGADLAVLSALASSPVAGSRVFAAFGPGGVGVGSSSAPASVALAAFAGVPVSWWAGGGGPAVPLRGRLAARSLALVRALAAAGGSLFVFPSALPPAPWGPAPFGHGPFGPGPFPSSGGSGSWSSAAAAALLRVPVVLFPPALPSPAWLPASALPALPGPAGWWSPAVLFGVPCLAWVPVVASPCLPGFAPAGAALER